ncbi:MAG: NUDIX hydrolase [Candidatus Roizmanbacteria bacterium]|nr:NUDIX hydrolase [Candidatus Roizmanbacteria bacterium]
MWKLIKRNKSYSSKFVNVYEDTVQLPSGKIIENYTVVEKPSIVMIVATDAHNNLLILKEYKYAANEVLLTLPAGHLKEKEDPVEAAKRELFEETGFRGDQFEETEFLHYTLISISELKRQIKNKEWKVSTVLAAIFLSGITQ